MFSFLFDRECLEWLEVVVDQAITQIHYFFLFFFCINYILFFGKTPKIVKCRKCFQAYLNWKISRKLISKEWDEILGLIIKRDNVPEYSGLHDHDYNVSTNEFVQAYFSGFVAHNRKVDTIYKMHYNNYKQSKQILQEIN